MYKLIIYQLNENVFCFTAYRTDEGKPWVLPVVKKMEKKLAADDTLNKEYLPVLGLEQFTNAATSMLLGANCKAITEGRVSNSCHNFL